MTTARDHCEEIKTAAEKLYAAKPDWVVFYRDILGLRGAVRRRFPTMEAMAIFEQTEIYRQIQRMLADLRKRSPPKKDQADEDSAKTDPAAHDVAKPVEEETRVITVRIPQSLHDALRIEAFEHRTSINKLCISKLLQFINSDHVPSAIEEKKEKEEANL